MRINHPRHRRRCLAPPGRPNSLHVHAAGPATWGPPLTRSTIEALAEAIAADDFAPLERLFLAANARPPLVVWQPDPVLLRSPVLVRLAKAWQRASCLAGGIPSMADAQALVDARDGEWTMLLAPPPETTELPAPTPLHRFVYRHYGAGIARQYGRDMTGQTLAAFPGHIGSFFAAVYEAVRLRPEPIFTEHEPPATVLVRSWRRLVLPLAAAGQPVSGFLVGNVPESAVGTLLDVMYDAALVIGADGRIRLANRAAEGLLGNGGPPLLGSSLDDHLPGLTEVMQQFAEDVEGVGALGRREVILRRGRRRRLLEVSIGGTRAAGEPLLVLVLRDLTERAEREQALESIAFHDELTGVLNRRGLHQHAWPERRRGQRRARRREDSFGLMILDLDGLKALNDTHGHAAGDAVLTSVARRIADSLRGDDAVARWGGDEFVVVIHGVVDPADLAAAAEKLLAAIRRPHRTGDEALAVSASIGAALYPRDGVDFDAVFAAADKALYAAKSAGGNRHQLAPGGTAGEP
jgi:diguanylate cyclase (GGDEF)-like protein/PAS domain S-box-containing protein